MSNQIVKVGNKELSIDKFANVLSATGSLLGPRRFIAQKYGLCVSTHEKSDSLDWSEIKDRSTKDVIEQVVASGFATKEQVKADIALYNGEKEAFFIMSTQVAALAAADPNMRKEVRIISGTKGVIGMNIKARFAKASGGSSARTAELEAENARLKALLGAQTLYRTV